MTRSHHRTFHRYDQRSFKSKDVNRSFDLSVKRSVAYESGTSEMCRNIPSLVPVSRHTLLAGGLAGPSAQNTASHPRPHRPEPLVVDSSYSPLQAYFPIQPRAYHAYPSIERIISRVDRLTVVPLIQAEETSCDTIHHSPSSSSEDLITRSKMFPTISKLNQVFVLFSLLSLPLPQSQAVRKIAVDNQCSGSLYMAVGATTGKQVTLQGDEQPGGWEQKTGEKFTFGVTDDWTGGRVWARTGCSSTKDGDGLRCIVGQCTSGKVECDGSKYGSPGATLAEFNMANGGQLDYYDVSIVEGYNLPMEITSSDPSCMTGSCGVGTDLLNACDPKLVYPKGSDRIWSCNSACGNDIQFQDGINGKLITADKGNNPACCQKNGVAVGDSINCPNTYVPFYTAIKKMCHNAYIYPVDDLYPDAVSACSSKSEYTITFCPGGHGSGLDPPLVSSAKSLDPSSGNNKGNVKHGGKEAPEGFWPAAKGQPVAMAMDGDTSSSGGGGVTNPKSAVSTSVRGVGHDLNTYAKATDNDQEAGPAAMTSKTNPTPTNEVAGSSTKGIFPDPTISPTSTPAPVPADSDLVAEEASKSASSTQGEVTTTFTSSGKVYVEVAETSVVTVTARDVACSRGKRRLGDGTVGC
ncbi:hypothetical protein IAR55_006752 [Kwoniella newhampshirensis]|uniref:Thaumatin family protein n=1 Tax=Kwoniella newhampshirensis TaxID=1651941 RepID=A0AAW0YED7_9TREE